MSLRRSSGRILSWLLRAGNVRTGPPRLSLPPVGAIQTQAFSNIKFLQLSFESWLLKITEEMGLGKSKQILLFFVVVSLVMMLNIILFYIRTMLKRLGLYFTT